MLNHISSIFYLSILLSCFRIPASSKALSKMTTGLQDVRTHLSMTFIADPGGPLGAGTPLPPTCGNFLKQKN